MSEPVQVVAISATSTAFTAVCEICLGIDTAVGLTASTFAGRLDLDLPEGVFLCRRGHQVTVARVETAAEPARTAAA
ncbi:MAG: hypothetical protein KGI93_02290 [Acidobacteriota bacterium]|nr:hypothetical protein [Acidobacteriota bacterium]MDE3191185.1 hypothetical protein [Acidobacteriota bacterium]